MRLLPLYRLGALLLLGIVLSSAVGVIAEESIEQQTQTGNQDGSLDVCEPLVEARSILASLQPAPYAHLVDKVGSLATNPRSWGHSSMSWNDDGPLSATLRLLPRLVKSIATFPRTFTQALASSLRLPGSSRAGSRPGTVKISRGRRDRIEKMLKLIGDAEKAGCLEAIGMMGKLRMLPPKGVKQDLNAAFDAYKRLLDVSPDPEAQFLIGFFHATGLGGAPMDQGKATLYYTFAALQGYRPAEMALGYRYWAGIGVKEDCLTALDWYEAAAESSYSAFLAGPPGGLTLPLTPTRLSDRHGGIYGPHASWTSTGANSLRAAVRASSAAARGETEKEVLEYYQYHSDRDSFVYTVRLGRLFYLGSVYFLPGGLASGAEGVGEIPQDFRKAKEYFMRAARQYWLTDFDGEGKVAPKRKMNKEGEEGLREPAMVAAAFLGRMALRGEGGKADYKRAKMWLERAAELGDREAHNGLGIIHRDGLLVPVDKQKAYSYFQAAAGQDLAEAQVNLAKLHLERGEITQATQYLEAALRQGSPYEALHLSSRLHAQTARSPSPGAGAMCGVGVAYYKLVAEKGNWGASFIQDADKAWLRGEEGNALLGWWIAAEMGYEAGQNNVAYRLGQGAGVEWAAVAGGKERELGLWVRSAAQDNVDAMVKVGDYYYKGVHGSSSSSASSSSSSFASPDLRFEKAASYYQTAADTQTSSMAYWNLGWMHQNGEGVPRDWHLAKRYYDLAGETSGEAGLAVGVSLVGLYLKSWWVDFRSGGAIPGLPLFEEDDNPTISAWEQLKSIFSPTYYDDEGYDIDDSGLGLDGGVLEREEGVDDWSGSGWNAEQGGGGAGDVDGLGMGMRGVGGPGMDDAEDVFESGVILGLVLLLGGLVWLRGRWVERGQQAQQAQQGVPGQNGPAGGQANGAPGAGWPGHPEQQPPAATAAAPRGQEVPDQAISEEDRVRERERERQRLGIPVGWEPPLP